MTSGTPLRADRDERVLAFGEERVAIAWNPDGGVWYVQASSVPGLQADGETLEALEAELPALIAQLRTP